MGQNPTPTLTIRIASAAHVVANRILAADFAQTVMILVTVAAATTYGWIEGYMIRANLGDQKNFPLGNYFGLSSYHIAFGIILGLMTGGFALIKARNMFARGNRYFLFSFIGNYPLSWLIEDFTYFLFNPMDTLTANLHRDNFGFGSVWVYGPWIPGAPKAMFPIPVWYFLVFAWFLGCQWYAHRCTVYDATIKDELGQEILPKIPPIPLPTPVERHESTDPRRISATVPKIQPPQTAKTPLVPKVTKGTSVTPSPKPRSVDAEAALKRMREKWVRNDGKPDSSS